MALRDRGGVWHYRFKLDGKEYSRATAWAATKPNAKKALQQEAEHRLALREGRQTRRILVREFSDAAAEFLDWVKVEHRERPNSFRRVAVSFTSIRQFFGRDPVSAIDEGRIERYKTWRVKEHGVRDITLRHDLHALSKFFRFAVKQRWAQNNPLNNVKIPSEGDAVRIHVLSVSEENEYFARAAEYQDLHDVGRLILNQGMRPEEVTRLRKENINLERRQVQIGKGKSLAARRVLDLTNESMQILGKRMQHSSSWLFPSRRNPGEPILRVNGAHDRVCANAKAVGVPLNFVLYDLRHTFATRMAEAGIDLATLAAILGHSSIRIVQRYVHPTAAHKKAAMQKYGEVLEASAGRKMEREGRPN